MLRAPATLVAIAAVVAGCSSPAPVVPETRPALSDGAAAMALGELAAALDAGDPTGNEVVDTAVANAARLRVEVHELRFVDEDPGLTADLEPGEWAVVAELAWQVTGFDRAPAEAEVTVRLEQAGDGVRVAGFGGGERPLPLWLSGDLVVRRTPEVVVAGTNEAAVARVDRLARRAADAVAEALGERPRLVVEVPTTGEGLDRALGAPAGEYAAIAAVTTYAGRHTGRRTPVHVFVNPDVLGGLGEHGAQVVMTHEVTHLATDAVRARSPLWLLEGYADHVALRDSSLPLSRTAGLVAAQVREDGVPEALPTVSDFDTQASHLGAVYESAWRAVEVLVAARGEGTLRELYRRTASGESADAALRALYGFGEEELTRRWQADLRRIAQRPAG